MGIGLSRPASDAPGDFDQPAIAAPTHESKVNDQQLSPLASWQAYPLSWVDRLTDWVQCLTISPWAFYLALDLVLWLVLLLSDWAGGAGGYTDRGGLEGLPRRLLQRDPGGAFPGQDGAQLAAAVPDSTHRLSHPRSRLGNGRQGSDCWMSKRVPAHAGGPSAVEYQPADAVLAEPVVA